MDIFTNIPDKIPQFEISIGVAIIIFSNKIVSWILKFIHISDAYIYGLCVIASIILIIHGLPKMIRNENLDMKIKLKTLEAQNAGLTMKISNITAFWDVEDIEDSDGNPHKINMTHYRISLNITNKSTVINTVCQIVVSSQTHGRLSPRYSKIEIEGRKSKSSRIDATLNSYNAPKGDIITVKIKDIDNKVLTDTFKILNYEYYSGYIEEHHLDEMSEYQ